MARWHRLSCVFSGCMVFGLLALSPESWGKEHEHIGVVLAVQGTAEVRTSAHPAWERLKFRDHVFLDETIRTHENGKLTSDSV
ncbi:hypothetical protein C2W62_13790 [Candidatus Entotheonella serta]|nr:hypothetical protein C2W62_13790 [Candidatus Entotheonella serta]